MLARWPQVKMDAAWGLIGGFKDVDKHVNTWLKYDQTQEFEPGSQPAKTHSHFGATLPNTRVPAGERAQPDDSSGAASATGNVRYVSARVALNMRTGPSTDFEVIKVLQWGTAVEILEEGPWSKVRENGTVGYVASNYLSLTIPTPLAPPVSSATGSGRLQTGMNINPDAHGLDVDRLRGLNWVRLVYKADARQRSVDKAFTDQYQQLIQAYTGAGINCLLILNQETVWGNTPWYDGQDEDWSRYADSLAQVGKHIAELCQPFANQVAYQIWNEQDSHPDNPAAISISPNYFALVLDRTAAAIRQVTSTSPIVIGGLNSGPDNAVDYVRRVQAKLSGRLPVDALAYHPYGRYVKTDPFYNRVCAFSNEPFPNCPSGLRRLAWRLMILSARNIMKILLSTCVSLCMNWPPTTAIMYLS